MGEPGADEATSYGYGVWEGMSRDSESHITYRTGADQVVAFDGEKDSPNLHCTRGADTLSTKESGCCGEFPCLRKMGDATGGSDVTREKGGP